MAEAANEVLDSHLDFLLREFNEKDSSDDVVPCSQISTCTNNGDKASMILCSQNKNYSLTQSKFLNKLPNQENRNNFTPFSYSCTLSSLEEEDLPVTDVLDSAICNPTMADNNKGDLTKRSVEHDSDKYLSFKRKKTETCSQPVMCSSYTVDKDDFCRISSWPGCKKLNMFDEGRKNSNCSRNSVEIKENMQCSNESDLVLAKTQHQITLFPLDIQRKHYNTLPLHISEVQVNRNDNAEAKTCAETKSYEFDSSCISTETEHSSDSVAIEAKSSTVTPSLHDDAEEEIDAKYDLHIKNQMKLMSEARANIFDAPDELFKMQETPKSPKKLQNFHNRLKIFHPELELIGVQGQSELLNCQVNLELSTCERSKILTCSVINENLNQLEKPKAMNVQEGTELFSLHEQVDTLAFKVLEPSQSNHQKVLKSPVMEEQLELASVNYSETSNTYEESSRIPNTEKHLTLSEIKMQLNYDVKQSISQTQADYSNDQKLQEKSEFLNIEQPILQTHTNSSEGQELSDKLVQEKCLSVNVHHQINLQNVEKEADLHVAQKLQEPTLSEHQPQFLSFEDHIEPINVSKELETTIDKEQNVQLQFCQWQFRPLNNQKEQDTVRNGIGRGGEVSVKDEQTKPITTGEQMKESNAKVGNVFHGRLDQSNMMETIPGPKEELHKLGIQEYNVSIHDIKRQEMQENDQHYKESSRSNTPINEGAGEGCQHVTLQQNPQKKSQKQLTNVTFRQTSTQVHCTLDSEYECEQFSNLREPFNFSYDTQKSKLVLSDEFAEVAMIENLQDAAFVHKTGYQIPQVKNERCQNIMRDNLPDSVLPPLLVKNNYTTEPDVHAFQEVPISSGHRDYHTYREEPQKSRYDSTQPDKFFQEPCAVDVEIYVHSKENYFPSLMHESTLKNVAEKTTHNIPPPALKNFPTDQKIDVKTNLHCPKVKQLQNPMKRKNFDHLTVETEDKNNFMPNHLLAQIRSITSSPVFEPSRKECRSEDDLKREKESLAYVDDFPNDRTVCNKNMLLVKNENQKNQIALSSEEDQMFGSEGKGAQNNTFCASNKTIETAERSTFFNNGKQTIQGPDHIVPDNHLYADDEWKEVSLYGDALAGKQGHSETLRKRAFHWNDVYEASLLKPSNEAHLENHFTSALDRLQPLHQTQRPLRVGLSRKQKVKSLHDK